MIKPFIPVPTHNDFAMLRPPIVLKDPVVIDVASVAFVMDANPLTVNPVSVPSDAMFG
jgi:hypothetical protein